MLSELKQIKAEIQDKRTLLQADMDKEPNEMMNHIGNLYRYLDELVSFIYDVEDKIYEHKAVGHLPKLSASQMKKVLDKCGIGEDFEVVPTMKVYASRNGNKVCEVDLAAK